MKFILILFLVITMAINTIAQTSLTQVVRGIIMDAQSQITLPGATIIISNNNYTVNTTSDEKGNFKINKVPIGRQNIKISYIGYKTITLQSFNISSGKEVVLEIKMEEEITSTKEVEIKANRRKDQPINKMAYISARSFSVEETERYAGSLGDPSRMAANFAGVRMTSDMVNDIVIRGNSPSGLLWKLEGLTIPNPNHFGSLGSTGGPISMLNNNVLSSSDFFTGAFPAEYGNAISGVFDLNLRSGNNQKTEFLAQVGFNGFEAGIEGPLFSKSSSSFIANYRYSTLGVFATLGLNVGIIAIPFYQDLCFKFDIPSKKFGRFSFFGITGKNSVGINNEKTDTTLENMQNNGLVGISGITNTLNLSKTSYLKTTIGFTFNKNFYDGYHFKNKKDIIYSNYIDEWDTLDLYGSDYSEKKTLLNSILSKKINARNNLKFGAGIEYINVSFMDSFYYVPIHNYRYTMKIKDDFHLIQSFIQWQHHFSSNLSIVSGMHFQECLINYEKILEPRFAIKWNFTDKQAITLGYGLHSQLQNKLIYFVNKYDKISDTYIQTNKNLKFSKSHQLVSGYNHSLNTNARLKIELYYQYLYDIPVSSNPSYISLINHGSSFASDFYVDLINKGTGKNYGTELTIEKFLSNNFYYLYTLSLFESKYTGSDGIERNTMYNGNFVQNVVGGYEFILKNNKSLIFDLRAVWAGGMRKIPIDLEKSRIAENTIYDTNDPYKTKYPDYYRIDFKISYKINRPTCAHTFAFDLTNVTNRHNHFLLYYNSLTRDVSEIANMGIIPVVLYRVNF